MEKERVLSRTPEGRQQLQQNLSDLISKMNDIYQKNPPIVENEENAAATLANLFSDDENGKVLKLCSNFPTLLPNMLLKLQNCDNSNLKLFICISVCICNAWKQGKLHRHVLNELGCISSLFICIEKEKFCSQSLNTLKTLLSVQEEEEDGKQISINSSQIEIICKICSQKPETSALKLLLSSTLFYPSINKKTLQIVLQTIINGIQSNNKEVEELLKMFLENILKKRSSIIKIDLIKLDILEILKSILINVERNTNEDVVVTICEICSQLITNNNNNNGTTTEGDSQQQQVIYLKIIESNFDDLWIRLISKASDSIPYEVSKRITDQSIVLPHATTRLNCLNCLLTFSVDEARSRRLLEKNCHVLFMNLAIHNFEYDYEATRYCVNIVKNLILADSRRVVMDCNLTTYVLTLLKSQDNNTSFVAAGTFKMGCCRTGKTDFDSWARLVVNGQDLITMLSLDLGKTHPYTRVELARSFAALMEGITQFEGTVPALETSQAVKFVSFLLQSPQPELHLEALNGICGLPDNLLKALPSLEIECVPGIFLVDRVKEIYEKSKDSFDSIQILNVSNACERLLQKMGVDI